MPQLGVPELVLILVIVVAIFGAGKLANIGGALGKGVRDFRRNIRDEDAARRSEELAATPRPLDEEREAPRNVDNDENA